MKYNYTHPLLKLIHPQTIVKEIALFHLSFRLLIKLQILLEATSRIINTALSPIERRKEEKEERCDCDRVRVPFQWNGMGTREGASRRVDL